MNILASILTFKKQIIPLIFLLSATIINAQSQKKSTLLTTDTSIIQEQVYIGYGSQNKKDITGAISYANANQIAERKATGLLDAIQGQVTGVQIAQESGRPGTASSVIARGVGTFLDLTSPAYIVDGAINVNPDGLNPADIESVQIMKDAAAAGIYGPESSNGIIIITTKKGSRGKPHFNCNVLTSFGKIDKKIPEASLADYKLYLKKLNGRIVDTFPYNANNNYQDLITQTAVRNQVDLSIGGGGKKLNYYGSLGYLADKGIILNSWSNIGRARFNLDYNPTSKLSFGTRLQGYYRKENRLDEANVIPLLIERSPMLALYNPDGSYTSPIAGAANPLAISALEKNSYITDDESLYGFASYKFTSYLKLTIDGHLTYDHLDNQDFSPSSLSYISLGDYTGAVNNKNKYSLLQGYLNFDKTISKKHRLSALIGLNKGKETQSSQENSGYNQSGIFNSSSSDSWYKTKSDFARVGYSFSEKYLVNVSINREGSDYSNPKWYYFETVSAGWRFSDEKFMEWSKQVLTDGKLRVSYGTTNRSKIITYQYNNSSNYPYNFGNDTLNFLPITLFSAIPTPEQRSQLNAGIDLSFFNGKLNLYVDVYSKQTKNAFIEVPIPISYNSSSIILTNEGTITNKGIEFSIDANPIKGNSFSWNVSLNMSFNKNRVTDLGNNLLAYQGNNQLWQVSNGGSIGDLYGFKALGVYQYDASNAYSSDWQLLTTTVKNNNVSYSLNGQPYTGVVKQINSDGIALKGGDMIWQNINSTTGQRDSSIDDRARAILGNTIPKCTGGITNIFNYKQFSFSFNFYFSFGNKIYNGESYTANELNNYSNTPTPAFINNAWTKQGDVTTYPSLKLNYGTGNTTNPSSLYVEDASFIRLRNIRFTYHLPHPHLSASKNNEVSFYLFANNIAKWTKYSGYDPEMSVTNGTTAGYDAGRYPRKKEAGVGVSIGF